MLGSPLLLDLCNFLLAIQVPLRAGPVEEQAIPLDLALGRIFKDGLDCAHPAASGNADNRLAAGIERESP